MKIRSFASIGALVALAVVGTPAPSQATEVCSRTVVVAYPDRHSDSGELACEMTIPAGSSQLGMGWDAGASGVVRLDVGGFPSSNGFLCSVYAGVPTGCSVRGGGGSSYFSNLGLASDTGVVIGGSFTVSAATIVTLRVWPAPFGCECVTAGTFRMRRG